VRSLIVWNSAEGAFEYLYGLIVVSLTKQSRTHRAVRIDIFGEVLKNMLAVADDLIVPFC